MSAPGESTGTGSSASTGIPDLNSLRLPRKRRPEAALTAVELTWSDLVALVG
jgi:hypothetical protein